MSHVMFPKGEYEIIKYIIKKSNEKVIDLTKILINEYPNE
jgi:hypothetical protein